MDYFNSENFKEEFQIKPDTFAGIQQLKNYLRKIPETKRSTKRLVVEVYQIPGVIKYDSIDPPIAPVPVPPTDPGVSSKKSHVDLVVNEYLYDSRDECEEGVWVNDVNRFSARSRVDFDESSLSI